MRIISTVTTTSVFCSISLPEHVGAAMREAFRFVVAGTHDAWGELARRDARGERFDAIITGIGCAALDAAAIAALPGSVRIVATYSVGVDHIDLNAARTRGLAVANTPGALVDAVADAALFLMLGAARRATESLALIRGRGWSGWRPDQLLGIQLSGRTLGIYGMGEIGGAIAVRAKAFGMEVAYCNRKPAPRAEARFVADPLELVAASDILLLAAPSTAETRGFVNAATLDHARTSMILVNIARGDLVVDADLIAALRDGRILAAALDVFTNEPMVAPGYFDLPNVFMTPHIGSSTVEARWAMGAANIRSIRAVMSGDPDPARLA